MSHPNDEYTRWQKGTEETELHRKQGHKKPHEGLFICGEGRRS